MRKLISLLIVIFLAACSGNGPAAIQKKITEKKKEIASLNAEVIQLEAELAKIDTSAGQELKTVVYVQELQLQEFDHYVNVNGKVEAINEAWISPEINGQIKKIHVNEGNTVNQGQLLISLSTEVISRNIDEIKTSLELADQLYKKQSELWDQKIGTEVQFLQAKNNKESLEARLATLQEQLDMANLRAPFSGIIEKIMVKEGELAMPGTRLIYMVNPNKLRIKGNLSENYIRSVKEGERVEVSFPNYEDMNIVVPISRVGSVIDNDSRTFEIELSINNPKQKLKPNQLATLKINDFHTDSALVVPSIILQQDNKGYYMYIADGKDEDLKAKKIYVTPGQSYGDRTVVVDGLKKGMNVIVGGYNLVNSGSEIKIKESSTDRSQN
jgi:RND family efflux transporter MFP subunit